MLKRNPVMTAKTEGGGTKENAQKYAAQQQLQQGGVLGAMQGFQHGLGTKKPSGGRGGGGAAPVNPYKGQVDKWAGALNDAKKPAYQDSYGDKLAAQAAGKAPAYESKFQDKIDGLLDQIAGRGPFQYDAARDPLYQQYRAQYMQNGQQAMRDTMGQAAGLTGGYGSSYASVAGNQAYQQHLGQLNDRMLELYNSALGTYQAEGNRLQQALGNYQTEEGAHRDRFESDRADWRQEQQAQMDHLAQQQALEYQQYLDALAQYNRERETALDEYRHWYDRYIKG